MQRIIGTFLLGGALLASGPAHGQVRGMRQSSAEQASPVRQPRSPEVKTQLDRARTAFESGASMMEAKVRVDRVLKKHPDDVAARKLRAQVLLALNRPAGALADARRAAKLTPQDGEAHLLMAEAAGLEGDTTTARRALERAADRVADEASLHVRLAWTATHLGLLNRAEAYARTALALNSSLANAYYQLARVFVRKEQPGDAAMILKRGFESSLLDPIAVRQDSLLHRLTDHERLQEHIE